MFYNIITITVIVTLFNSTGRLSQLLLVLTATQFVNTVNNNVIWYGEWEGVGGCVSGHLTCELWSPSSDTALI